MGVFTEIPGGTVILRAGGVFRQAKLAKYDGRLFAARGGGFVLLHKDGSTSHLKTSWEGLEGAPRVYHQVGFSALYLTNPSEISKENKHGPA